ncbi:hypothetical protein C6P46_006972 [Rhodotorula mucilaginosa]|uniref:WLM-domain-containing protein n=1 Tax=Rhodotorula mucilaginosa TaxID=5537 RepID=A0A9P6VXV6_RHOMI|nr:hypothetical protein C6P46_006972 [Rhodotorula mucilaginosa]
MGSRQYRWGEHGGVGRISVLQNMENPQKAEELLTEIHSLVKPIMKKHGWYLPELCEFFPKNERLLGVNWNGGDKICIRLRPSHDKYSFLDIEESLIPTMLHELTHNHRAPHDDEFFRFLEVLTDEFHTYRKQRFLAWSGVGQRVGAGLRPGSVNVREARVKHQQEVARQQKLLGRGGRLGGSGPAMPSPAAIAEAVERRLRATKGCGGRGAHGQGPEIAAEVERAVRESVYIDLTTESDDPDIEIVPKLGKKAKPRTTAKQRKIGRASTRAADAESSGSDIEIISEKPAATKQVVQPKSRRLAEPDPAKRRNAPSTPRKARSPRQRSVTLAPPSPQKWTCSKCARINDTTTSKCVACSASLAAIRPLKASQALYEGDGWSCHLCSTINEHIYWSCRFCTAIKLSSARG